MKSFSFILSFLILFTSLTGTAKNSKALADARQQLAAAKTASDSITPLFNIYDLSSRNERKVVAPILFATAQRLNNVKVQLDLLRNLSKTFKDNNEAITKILAATKALPSSAEQLETVTYIEVLHTTAHARVSNEADKQRMLVEYIRQFEDFDSKSDMTDEELNAKILSLFNAVVYLSFTHYYELMQRSLGDLEVLINRLPFQLLPLRNIFFSQAAMAYSEMDLPQKSIEADRELTSILNGQMESYRKQGRPYREFNNDFYEINRRMLGNAAALDRPEVEKLYNEIHKLAEIDSDIAADLRDNPRASAYYYMAIGDWETAVPLLKRSLELTSNANQQRKLIRGLIKGAHAIGDQATELQAATTYIKMLEEFKAERSTERVGELQLVSEINNLRRDNLELELEKSKSKHARIRGIIIISLILVPILVMLIIGLFMMYRRTRHLTVSLAKSNNELKDERDKVVAAKREAEAARDRAQKALSAKSEFINNISHEIMTPLNAISDYSRLIADCITDEKRRYLAQYAELVDLNNDLVQRMVNDVLSLAKADNMRMKINLIPCDVSEICRIVADTAASTLQPGVTLTFSDRDRDSLLVETDRERVEQVLLNLLTNSTKFTSEGSVTLDYVYDDEKVTFSVTDTGIGIPAGREEIIFERFEKIGRDTQGAGLGLSVSRLIARLLKGDVYVDKTYKEKGARFIFWIPIKAKKSKK